MQIGPNEQTAASELAALTEVFEIAPAFMAVLGGPEHVFEMVNPAYAQLIGHRDVVGKPLRIGLPEIEDQGFIKLLDAVLQTGSPFIGTEMKVLLQHAPGEPQVVRYLNFVYQARRNQQGQIIGVFVHGVDVTDLVIARQTTEEHARQIKRQSQLFDSLLTNITDFVYAFDREGRFIYSNRPLLDLLGITLEGIVGKTFFDLPYPEELAATLHAYILQVAETGQPIVDETPYTNPTGQAGYYEYIFSPVLGDDGEVALVAGSTRDITERVLQERQKDEFLGVVSHELKTPVTSVKAYVQVLQRRLAREGNTGVVEHLGKIDTQINKLTALIGDLLDVTKIKSGRLQFHETDFALDDQIAESVEEVQRTAERHTIVIESASLATIYGDRDRIGQALVNLLTNAVKYSPEETRVVVSATSDGATATVSVRDAGVGISADKTPYVFDQFYRAVNDQQGVAGLGLGLYIASEIVQRHGGNIWVESVEGQGSTFSFSLPVVDSQQAVHACSTSPAERAHG